MLILNQLFKFVKLLHSETAPSQLCLGFVLGMFMGFTPIFTLHWGLYLLLLVMLRINMGAAFMGFALFKVLAFPLDPFFHSAGMFMLRDTPSLHGLWTWLYHAPIVPYTRFNNTVVLGSFLFATLLAAPLFLISKVLVLRYRDTVVRKIKQSHFAKTVMATRLYRAYAKYQEFKN